MRQGMSEPDGVQCARLLSAVFDSAHLLIANFDTQFNFITVNRAYAEADGRTPEFFPGKNHFDLYPHQENEAIFRKVVETGEPYFEQARKFTYPKNPERGESFWDWSLIPIRDDAGAITALSLQLLDVTDRIRALESARASEARVRRSERQLSAMLNNLDDVVYRSRLSGEIVWISPAVHDLLGYGPEELIGTDAARLYSDPAIRREMLEALERQGGRIRNFTTIMLRKGEDPVWVSLNARHYMDSSGKVAGIEGTIRNFSELREAHTRFRTIIEDSPMVAIRGFDREGIIRHWNGASTALYGYTAEEAIGRPVQELLLPGEAAESFRLSLEEVWASGRSSRPVEWQVTTRDGEQCWVYSAMVPVKDGERVQEVFCMEVDVTRHRRTEQALQESEARLAEAQAIAHLGGWEWDVPSGRMEWSAEGCRILGVSMDALVSYRTLLRCIHPDDRDRVQEAVRESLYHDLPFAVDYRVVRPDGEVRSVRQLALVEYGDEGEPVRVVGALQDVTELASAEAEKNRFQAQLMQAQKMEAVGILAGGVAHDFNNLLTSILGFTELALEKTALEDQRYLDLKEIYLAAERAAGLTRQLLLFSRKQPMSFARVQVGERLEAMLKMLVRIIGEDVEIYTDIDTGLWAVRGDGVSIDQMILNLSINARDAMPEGGRLGIRAENAILSEAHAQRHPEAASGRFVRIAVSDTGIGMDEETVSRIFEPFFTTKDLGKGTGLGMSVAHGIAKQHGGWIEIRSTPGAGTTFFIYLPAIVSDAEGRKGGRRFRTGTEGGGRRVMVVEDEKALRTFAEVALTKNGYAVVACATAGEAMATFKREGGRFDLVFSDVVLPDRSGIQLVEDLLAGRPAMRVLLSSGYPDHKSGWLAIQEKGFSFIQKPYTLSRLLEAVREELSREAAFEPKRMEARADG